MLTTPDETRHNNPNLASKDADFVRGGARVVADRAELYALTAKVDQLKQHVTVVTVLADDLFSNAETTQLLIDITKVGQAAGWRRMGVGGHVIQDAEGTVLSGTVLQFMGGLTATASGGTITVSTAGAVAPSVGGAGEWMGPLVITEPGTYSGERRESTVNTAVPAILVQLATPGEVIIENTDVRAVGHIIKIDHTAAEAQVTINAVYGYSLAQLTATAVKGRFTEANGVKFLRVSNCKTGITGGFVYQDGTDLPASSTIQIENNFVGPIDGTIRDRPDLEGLLEDDREQHTWGGSRKTWRYKRSGISLNQCRGFVNSYIRNNYFRNPYQVGFCEDVINIYKTSGAGETDQLSIYDNLIWQNYAPNPRVDYRCGAILTDGGDDDYPCEYVNIYENTAVATWNGGLSLLDGRYNRLNNNVVVTSGKVVDGSGVQLPEVGLARAPYAGISVHNFYSTATFGTDEASGNIIAYMHHDGYRNDTTGDSADPGLQVSYMPNASDGVSVNDELAAVQTWKESHPYWFGGTSQGVDLTNITGPVTFTPGGESQIANGAIDADKLEDGLREQISSAYTTANQASSSIGLLSSLTSTVKTSLVAAYNELKAIVTTNTSNIGSLASLATTAKGDLVSAVNELKAALGVNTANIGSLGSLLTTAQGSLVAAVNELYGLVQPSSETQAGSAINMAKRFQKRTLSGSRVVITSLTNMRLGATVELLITSNSKALTGSVTVGAGGPTISGTGTSFTTQLAVGDKILVDGMEATIATITSDVLATATANWWRAYSGANFFYLDQFSLGSMSGVTVVDSGFPFLSGQPGTPLQNMVTLTVREVNAGPSYVVDLNIQPRVAF